MFSVGDKVFYPMHGVGIIESIEEKEVLGTVNSYYVLLFIDSNMSAMVPCSTAENIGIRYISSKEECEKIYEFLKNETVEDNEAWNKRYRDNFEKLRGGNIHDIAYVTKSLRNREIRKGLSAGEKRMLMEAKKVLFSELVQGGGYNKEELNGLL